jgi:hypothetical protein
MTTQNTSVHVIYLRPDGMIISKRPYSDWREIQDEYDDFMTSLGPYTEEDLLDFFEQQYGLDDARWAFSRERMREFMASDETVLESR